MKTAKILSLLFIFPSLLNAQSLIDPYQDHTGSEFPIDFVDGGIQTSYFAEYQIFFDEYFWDLDGLNLLIKIEVVGFPFQPLPIEPDIND